MCLIGGLGPFFSFTFGRTLSFSVYQKAKYKYSALIGQATGGDEPLVIVNRPGSIPTLATIACFAAAGATAGSIISFYAGKSWVWHVMPPRDLKYFQPLSRSPRSLRKRPK